MNENNILKILILILSSILIYLLRWELLYVILKIFYSVFFSSSKLLLIILIISMTIFLIIYALKSFSVYKNYLKEKKLNEQKFLTSIYQSRFEREILFNNSNLIDTRNKLDKTKESFKKKTPKISSLESKTPKITTKKDLGEKIERNLRSKEKKIPSTKKLIESQNYESLLL